MHEELRGDSATTGSFVIALTMAAVAFSAIARPVRSAVDHVVLAVAAVTAAWAAVLYSDRADAFDIYAVVAFSVVTILMATSLIRTAFVSDRRFDLYLGVLFALAFIIVRWTSLIENMLWSGLLLILTGGGLLAIAWFWRHRDRGVVEGTRS